MTSSITFAFTSKTVVDTSIPLTSHTAAISISETVLPSTLSALLQQDSPMSRSPNLSPS